jgi:hypothetical protein
MSTRVATLRALIEERFPDAAPLPQRTSRPVAATGVVGLDAILPGGGLPRGKLSVCPPQGGATSIFRAACRSIVAHRERAAWIDGAGTIAGAFWEPGPLLLRPKTPRHALRAAEELLRSGGFALVVLAGVEPQGTETVRLVRAAHEGNGALVALTALVALAALRLTTRILPHGYTWRHDPFGEPAEVVEAKVSVRARALGWNAHAEFPMPVTRHELRLSLEPGVADRRGAKRVRR